MRNSKTLDDIQIQLSLRYFLLNVLGEEAIEDEIAQSVLETLFDMVFPQFMGYFCCHNINIFCPIFLENLLNSFEN